METFHMICVNVSVSENRRCLRLYLYISDRENVLLFLELFYSFWLATLLFPISRGKQVCSIRWIMKTVTEEVIKQGNAR